MNKNIKLSPSRKQAFKDLLGVDITNANDENKFISNLMASQKKEKPNYFNCSKCKKKIPRGKESKTKEGEYHCFECVMRLFIKDYNKINM